MPESLRPGGSSVGRLDFVRRVVAVLLRVEPAPALVPQVREPCAEDAVLAALSLSKNSRTTGGILLIRILAVEYGAWGA
jgi:hypothetical protein